MVEYNVILLKMSKKTYNFVYIKVYILLYTITILIFQGYILLNRTKIDI
jgi:hypothetical protein